MLQLLLCSDVHTFTDNIRLAIKKAGQVDAVLISGDVESEKDDLLKAAGSLPLYVVCGNCDYYLNSDYPEELLIDISAEQSAGPVIYKSTELHYSAIPAPAMTDYSQPDFSFSDSALSGVFSPFLSLIKKSLFSISTAKSNADISTAKSTAKIVKEKRPDHIMHRILMTHGKEYNVPETGLLLRRADQWDADIVIFGHTHKFTEIPCRKGRKKVYFINPGCLFGDPKNPSSVLASSEICGFAVLQIGPEGEINVQKLTL